MLASNNFSNFTNMSKNSRDKYQKIIIFRISDGFNALKSDHIISQAVGKLSKTVLWYTPLLDLSTKLYYLEYITLVFI